MKATSDLKKRIANKAIRITLMMAQGIALTLTSAGCVNAISTQEATTTPPSPLTETYTPESMPIATGTLSTTAISKAENTSNSFSVEVFFDKSKFVAVNASDGREYQGYIQDDQFGIRLVDETNDILLIKKLDNWVVPKSKDYAEAFPPDLHNETIVGHSDGFEIPISVGLSKNVDEGINFSFTHISVTQKGADDLVSVFLHSSWIRYVNLMYHPKTSYEDYLELLGQDLGNITILNSITKKTILIDPRQGFSLVITGDATNKMPIRNADAFGFNFASDEKGRLLWASNSVYLYHLYLNPNSEDFENKSWFMFNSLGSISWIASLPDKCMIGDRIDVTCGRLPPPAFDILGTKFIGDYYDFIKGKSVDPLFVLK